MAHKAPNLLCGVGKHRCEQAGELGHDKVHGGLCTAAGRIAQGFAVQTVLSYIDIQL